MNTILETIQGPENIRTLSIKESKQLATEIREFLLAHVSKTGGHLSSNLGVVELTIALHQVFHTPEDQIVWDVGHQAYVHKILTGRKDRFASLRQKDGLSGFPKFEESPYDAFNTGHATTSISAAYGMAKARDVLKQNHEVVAVIGDGSFTGGMAYEAMNNAGKDKTKLIVVLNDNEMSISHNVGSVPMHLSKLRTRKGYVKSKRLIKKLVGKFPSLSPLYRLADSVKDKTKYLFIKGILFEELGFTYLGPVDGHDLHDLTEVLKQAKSLDRPVVVHVKTTKGKGYDIAERNASRYHGIGAFDPETGGTLTKKQETWSDVFGKTLTWIGQRDPSVVAVSAAMVPGTGLNHYAQYLPKRLYDVGIAEEHAVTFAAGMAKGGLKPCVALYSTFLQRAYDQIVHDVCMPQLPVVFAVDRSGVVGEDGETHQGVFDIAFLSHIPGMTVMAPSCKEELVSMMNFAFRLGRPCAIRYPKGSVPESFWALDAPIEYGKSRIVQHGEETVIVAAGACMEEAMEAAQMMKLLGYTPTVVDARFVAPLDKELLVQLMDTHAYMITVEDHVYTGGFGMQIAAFAKSKETACRVKSISLPDEFIAQDSRESILKRYGISAEGIVQLWEKRKDWI